jgi:hypothetical protein
MGLWVCGCVILLSNVQADEMRPHVIVLVEDGHRMGDPKVTAHGVLDEQLIANAGTSPAGMGWRGYRGDCLISPGRVACMSALLYGQHPLLLGVVSDNDWRRRPVKPVTGVSLIDHYQTAGYDTMIHGSGRDGKTLIDPWGVGEDKEKQAQRVQVEIKKSFSGEKPVFCMIRQGGDLDDAALAGLMRHQILSLAKTSTRPTVVLIVRMKPLTGPSMRGRVPDRYHYPANWYLYHYGKSDGFMTGITKFKPAKTDWELHAGLIRLLEEGGAGKIEYRIFHKANWPPNESPEKYRHRGSLVIGHGHALVDGLQLFPVTNNLEPDLTQPLDIAIHQKLHGKLLTQHARWWQQARKALYNPRAFPVGEEDEKSTSLTALDWRPSKIIHQDGTSPASRPVVGQKDLLDMLECLMDKKYRESFPAYSGSWSVHITRPGRYQITARILPREAGKPEQKTLAELQGGRAFFRLGNNQVELRLNKGASSVSVLTDAEAGVTDLECWFTGQLALERELGAFFVEIKRVGDKKFDLKAKPSLDKSPKK